MNVSCCSIYRRVPKYGEKILFPYHVFDHKSHIDWPEIEPRRICDENNNGMVSFQRALRPLLPVSPQSMPHIRIFPTIANTTLPGNISPC
jgi:hypothetical protein